MPLRSVLGVCTDLLVWVMIPSHRKGIHVFCVDCNLYNSSKRAKLWFFCHIPQAVSPSPFMHARRCMPSSTAPGSPPPPPPPGPPPAYKGTGTHFCQSRCLVCLFSFHTHTHTHTHAHAHTHGRTHAGTHTRARHTHTHTHARTHARACTSREGGSVYHVCVCTPARACVYLCVCVCARARASSRAHACTHVCICRRTIHSIEVWRGHQQSTERHQPFLACLRRELNTSILNILVIMTFLHGRRARLVLILALVARLLQAISASGR